MKEGKEFLPQGRRGAEEWQNDLRQNDFFPESSDKKQGVVGSAQ